MLAGVKKGEEYKHPMPDMGGMGMEGRGTLPHELAQERRPRATLEARGLASGLQRLQRKRQHTPALGTSAQSFSL